jgi:ABC-type branched-subunit amino acid transport system ATPase component
MGLHRCLSRNKRKNHHWDDPIDGAGKSTPLKVSFVFLNPQQGKALFKGHKIRDSLFSQLSLTFHGEDNLLLGRVPMRNRRCWIVSFAEWRLG